jgi:hypothetical protein
MRFPNFLKDQIPIRKLRSITNIKASRTLIDDQDILSKYLTTIYAKNLEILDLSFTRFNDDIFKLISKTDMPYLHTLENKSMPYITSKAIIYIL